MKRVGRKPVFFIVALLILVFAFTSFFGVSAEFGDLDVSKIKGADEIRWGIDIQGGVEATFYPVNDDGSEMDATQEQLDAAREIIATRLVNDHITDYELYTDYDNNRIIVRYPWKTDETEFDPETAISEISMTAMLTFRDGTSTKTEENSDGEKTVVPAGDIILTGDDVKEAYATMDSSSSVAEYSVVLELTDSGKSKFAEATKRIAEDKGTISIWLDDDMISAPTVQEEIPDGIASITSDTFTAETATKLANQINAGALPFKLATSNFGSINPQLGASALKAMLIAGIAALLVIFVFMIATYRLPGFVSCIALLGQVAGMIACVSGYLPTINSFTLTLPGIAGMILSIGMGVDANVITNERIREELRISGRSLDGAIKRGCSESFSAIFDGNVTTIIVAVILMGVFGSPSSFWNKLLTPFLFWCGTTTTGAVYSFGYTLLIGVILNFIMGVSASRLMLLSLSDFKVFRKKWLFGGVGK